MKWPLNDNHFSYFDRLKIAGFILDPRNRWTSGEQVMQLEKEWAAQAGFKYAVMTSSGSTAIELLARVWKHMYGTGKILLPALTWSTSVNPWIHAGFTPVFVDIYKYTLNMDYTNIYKHFDGFSPPGFVGIFPTATLGSPVMKPVNFGINFAIDSCESSFRMGQAETVVTSFYFGHQFTTGTEGGMLLTNNSDVLERAVLERGHGLTRELAKYTGKPYNNFEFECLGSNFRSNDIAAFIGRMDIRKFDKKLEHRNKLYSRFCEGVESSQLKLLLFNLAGAFSIPIIHERLNKKRWNIEPKLNALGIETRPILAGCLLKHKAFQEYGSIYDFPHARFIDEHGFYVGLHEGVTESHIDFLIERLNEYSR